MGRTLTRLVGISAPLWLCGRRTARSLGSRRGSAISALLANSLYVQAPSRTVNVAIRTPPSVMIGTMASDHSHLPTPADLLPAVRHHALAARAKLDDTNRYVRMDAAIHAGIAVELGAKALLLHLDPRLLSVSEALSHTLLDVLAKQAGHVHVGERAPKLVPSISARLAVELAARISPLVRDRKSRADEARKARNNAAHMAILDDSKIEDVVTGVEAFVAAVVGVLGLNLETFFGKSTPPPWDLRIQQQDEQIETAVRRKIEAAGQRYMQFVEGIGSEKVPQLTEFLVELAGPRPGDESVPEECPACGFDDARLSWEAEVDVEWDGSLYGGMVLRGLDCPRCGLELDAAEVEATAIDTMYYGHEDDDYREGDY